MQKQIMGAPTKHSVPADPQKAREQRIVRKVQQTVDRLPDFLRAEKPQAPDER